MFPLLRNGIFLLDSSLSPKDQPVSQEQNHQAGVALEVMRLLDGKMQTAE